MSIRTPRPAPPGYKATSLLWAMFALMAPLAARAGEGSGDLKTLYSSLKREATKLWHLAKPGPAKRCEFGKPGGCQPGYECFELDARPHWAVTGAETKDSINKVEKTKPEASCREVYSGHTPLAIFPFPSAVPVTCTSGARDTGHRTETSLHSIDLRPRRIQTPSSTPATSGLGETDVLAAIDGVVIEEQNPSDGDGHGQGLPGERRAKPSAHTTTELGILRSDGVFAFYQGLNKTTVQDGQRVFAGQTIGSITDKAVLHFGLHATDLHPEVTDDSATQRERWLQALSALREPGAPTPQSIPFETTICDPERRGLAENSAEPLKCPEVRLRVEALPCDAGFGPQRKPVDLLGAPR